MNRKISVALLIPLTIVVFFCFTEYRENIKYEKYLSSELANMISPLSSGILGSSSILNEVLKNKAVSQVQLEQLELNFSKILRYSQDVFYLAITTEKATVPEINNFTSKISSDVQFYLYHLGRTMKENTTLQLGSKDLQMLQLCKEINDKWAIVISENVIGATPDGMKQEYWDRYSEDGINDGYWIEVIKGLSKHADENKLLINLNE